MGMSGFIIRSRTDGKGTFTHAHTHTHTHTHKQTNTHHRDSCEALYIAHLSLGYIHTYRKTHAHILWWFTGPYQYFSCLEYPSQSQNLAFSYLCRRKPDFYCHTFMTTTLIYQYLPATSLTAPAPSHLWSWCHHSRNSGIATGSFTFLDKIPYSFWEL